MIWIVLPVLLLVWWFGGLAYVASSLFVLWVVVFGVVWVRGFYSECRYRRSRLQARRRYDKEHDASIAQLDVIHQWSDEVYR